MAVKEVCRRYDFSEASYYLWRSKFGGMTPSDAERLRELETENGRLKRLRADQGLENDVVMEILGRVVAAPARCALVRGLGVRVRVPGKMHHKSDCS